MCKKRKLLYQAIKYNNISVVESLIEEEINVNKQLYHSSMICRIIGKTNYTPLEEACFKGNFEIVKLILNAKAYINKRDNYNDKLPLICALVLSIHKDRFKIVKLLFERGADINIMTDREQNDFMSYLIGHFKNDDNDISNDRFALVKYCIQNNIISKKNLLNKATEY